jgi:hypothetical protein
MKDIKTFYIDKELHRRVKIEAAQRGMTLRAIVEAALRLYLDGQGNTLSNPKDKDELT